MTARAHLFRPIRDSEGNLRPSAEVTVYKAGTGTLIDQPMFASRTGSAVLTNPFLATSGVVDFYIEQSEDVRLSFVVGELTSMVDNIAVLPPAAEVVQTVAPLTIRNAPEIGQILRPTEIEGVAEWSDVPDLVGDAIEHHHDGDGVNSTALGSGAQADGSNSTAIGVDATANGDWTVAVGTSAQALHNFGVAVGHAATSGLRSIAVGYQAGSSPMAASWVSLGTNSNVTADRGVAIGEAAVVTALDGVALGTDAQVSTEGGVAIGRGARALAPNTVAIGDGAVAEHEGSVAIGTNARTTGTNQVVLGTPDAVVVVPGRLDATGGEVRIAGEGGRLGFFGVMPGQRPLIVGSRGGNTALGSLLSALHELGLVQDGTSA